MKIFLGILSILTIVAPAFAQDTGVQTQVEFGVESSRLSNDSPDWRAESFSITRKLGSRDVKALTLTHTNRFGLDDHQLGGLYSVPLSDKLTATLDADISPTHRVLAKHGVQGAVQYEFAPAWLLHGGLGNRRYDTANVNQASLMLEHYFSSFSVAAGWRPVRALGQSSSSAELRGSYYYGDANSVSLIVSNGQEATPINAQTVVLAHVRSAALFGRHWLSRQWAVNYGFSSTRQGSFYNLNSVRFSTEYAF